MRISLLAGLTLAMLGGCKSADDAVVNQQKAALEKLAADLAKVQDLAGMKQVLGEYAKSKAAMIQAIRAVPQDHIADFAARINRALGPSQDKATEALKDAQDRLLKGKKHPQVLMQTSMGPVKIELYEAMAPITVGNFLKYVDDKHYDGTIFHRVIADFMVQGGGFDPHMQEKAVGKPIMNEAFNGIINDRGTLAMARTADPNSATAQFFINLKSNSFLNRVASADGVGYTVFGKVIDGMEVVDKIGKVDTDTIAMHENVPVQSVKINSIRRLDKK